MKTGSTSQRTFLVSTSLDLSLKSFCAFILKAEVSANTVYCFENDLYSGLSHTHTHKKTHKHITSCREAGNKVRVSKFSNATFTMLMSYYTAGLDLTQRACQKQKEALGTRTLKCDFQARFYMTQITKYFVIQLVTQGTKSAL